MRRTYEAVKDRKYLDPETLISFDSSTISKEMLNKFRSECSKTPLKPGTAIQFYTKQELRKGIPNAAGKRISIPSPNLFDAAVLSFDKDSEIAIDEDFDLEFDSLFG